MSDPRNSAHKKKVTQEKAHHPSAHPEAGSDVKPTPDKGSAPTEAAKVAHNQADFEKSNAVLSKLKEMEFHSRANIETLAGLTLTIGDDLKQKEFSAPIDALYSAQDQFQTKIAALIENYRAKCDSLKEVA